MEIKVKIEAPELASALKDIAIALSAMANLSGTPVAAPAAAPVTEPPAAAPVTEPPADELKPADLKKKKIADEIVALGGTPPEKGSVAKFEKVLEALKAEQEETTDEETEETDTDTDTDTDEAGEAGEDVSLDDVRTLAYATIRKNPDNENKGKMALQGCLKQVKAKKVSDANQKQLNALVPLLEEYLGKSLAEVLAEAAE